MRLNNILPIVVNFHRGIKDRQVQATFFVNRLLSPLGSGKNE